MDEDYASRLFADDEGVKLGAWGHHPPTVRKIVMSTSDPRYARVGEMQRQLRAEAGTPFFYGWQIRRYYSAEEIRAARCFRLRISATFEPEGESCGTIYDEAGACPECGSGAPQTNDLRLDLRKVPRRKDIARSIADEWIV
ncbi:MAG: hypothetical protein ACRETG_13440, partial [Steroidobacteraceae bacterium]